MRRAKPCDSSRGFKSSRCIFSIKAMAAAARSSAVLIKTGTADKPASWAARKRRSPAIISYLPGATSRTSRGCIMPCSRILSANSCKPSDLICWRGWYLPACKAPKGKEVTLGPANSGWFFSPNKASSPRPRPFFLAIFMTSPRIDFSALGSSPQPAGSFLHQTLSKLAHLGKLYQKQFLACHRRGLQPSAHCAE